MSYESDNLTTSIKINMPTQDNNGVYICVATNEVGSMNKTFHIGMLIYEWDPEHIVHTYN